MHMHVAGIFVSC